MYALNLKKNGLICYGVNNTQIKRASSFFLFLKLKKRELFFLGQRQFFLCRQQTEAN